MAHKPKRKRRIMQDFMLTEISAVDEPAQEGARAVLIKRRAQAKKGTRHMHPQKRLGAVVAKGKASGLTGVQAMRELRRQMPPGTFEKFRTGKPAKATVAKRFSKADRARTEFDEMVAQLMQERGLGAAEAAAAVRVEFPELYQELQVATADPLDDEFAADDENPADDLDGGYLPPEQEAFLDDVDNNDGRLGDDEEDDDHRRAA